MFVVILSINNIYRQKQLVILVAVDSSSKKALLNQSLLLTIYKLIHFRGLCQSLFYLQDIDVQGWKFCCELPLYSFLLHASFVNFWSAQQLGITAQC